MPTFRSAKELEISRKILNCNTNDELIYWVGIIANELQLPTAHRFLSQTFLSIKCQLSDTSISHILSDGNNYLLENQSNSSNQSNGANTCKLGRLPKDVLYNVGSYLPLKASIVWSSTSHCFHKIVRNDEYFSRCKAETRTLRLDTVLIRKLFTTNGSLECYKQCERLFFAASNYSSLSSRIIDCSQNDQRDKCILHKLIEKCSKNYDLGWLKRIISNARYYYVSSNWNCLFDHVPINWMFDKNINTVTNNNSNNKNNKNINDIVLIGGAKSGRLNWNQCNSLGRRYYDYYVTDCNCDIRKVRQLGRISFNRNEVNSFDFLSKFCKNYSGVVISLPGIIDGLFTSMNEFFQMFHNRLEYLEIFVRNPSNDSIKSQYNIANKNRGIVYEFFREDKQYLNSGHTNNVNMQTSQFIQPVTLIKNKELIDDLHKNDQQLSFDSFLEKYKCNKSELPRISSLAINFSNNAESSASLSQLVMNDKLSKLLNMESTLSYLRLLVREPSSWRPLLPTMIAIIRKFGIGTNGSNSNDRQSNEIGKLEKVELNLRVSDKTTLYDITHDYRYCLNQFLLYCCLSDEVKTLIVSIGNETSPVEEHINWQVKIDKKEEFLSRNRNQLKSKIDQIASKSDTEIQKRWKDKEKLIKATAFVAGSCSIVQHFQFVKSFRV